MLITGGANGIGWSTAQEFLARGWRVAIGDHDAEAAAQRARESDGNLQAIPLDVRDADSVDRAFDSVVNAFGRLDCLVNNAGVQKWTSLSALDWSTWSSVLDVNLNGVARCLQAAGRYMLPNGSGSIVNVSSVSAQRAFLHRAPYSASKAAVCALTRSAAIEWAPRGLRVNAVGPGYVETQLIARFVDDGKISPAPLLQLIPMGRMALPSEIARVICFLASDDASYITGQTLFVDGGLLANSGLATPLTLES